uniref:Uncharacterized protein n=1 Tax=mine drainage metagenome TaxID=410659 RepID=E6QA73_9ZZZZ
MSTVTSSMGFGSWYEGIWRLSKAEAGNPHPRRDPKKKSGEPLFSDRVPAGGQKRLKI